MSGVDPCLSVVMPVYNEQDGIREVLQTWTSALDRLGVGYEFLVIDDGSRDNSAAVLRAAAETMPHVRVFHHQNMGHGPTILRGYREARGTWVFQTDSDNELDVGAFADLWQHRDDYDFLLGIRAGREAPFFRQLVTFGSRTLVRALFGSGVSDVNVPYRLMRGSELRKLLALIPENVFAPNVILSGLAVQQRLRIYETPVRHRVRCHGQSSLGSLTILRPAVRSLRETWQVARAARRERCS